MLKLRHIFLLDWRIFQDVRRILVKSVGQSARNKGLEVLEVFRTRQLLDKVSRLPDEIR